MTLEARLLEAVEAALQVEVTSSARVSGGDVAAAHRLVLSDGRTVFAKTHPDPPAGFFTTEAAGLAWLREPGVVAVPAVLAVSDGGAGSDGRTGGASDGRSGGEHGGASGVGSGGASGQANGGASGGGASGGVSGGADSSFASGSVGLGSPAFLVLEWVEEVGAAATTEADLGRALAELHRSGAPCFGRADRRTTGSRGLPNEPTGSWAEFYATQRLLPLAAIARDGRALPDAAIEGLERLATSGRLDAVPGADEPPARLHGDLWAGNRLVDRAGRSWLIDPAAHGGHREFDLAMMRLFGGFGPECFAAYEEVHPLGPGWQERVSLHQIAPLVVHAVKFGGGYVAAAAEAVARWSR